MKPFDQSTQTLKPFDLEAAKRGEPIQTRDGLKVKFIAHVPEAETVYRVVVLCGKSIYSTREDGAYCESEKSSYDLFMAPKKRRVDVYLNLYSDGLQHGYASRHAADRYANPNRLGGKAHHVIVEWEE